MKKDQLYHEGLAIIFDAKKFHNYLYGRHFTLNRTIVRCLTCSTKQTMGTHSERLSLSDTKSDVHSNADVLSRLPRPVTTTSDCLPGDLVHLVNYLSGTLVSAGNMKEWTTRDSILSQVRRYTLIGWLGEEFCPVLVLDKCVLSGCHVVHNARLQHWRRYTRSV